ncbi:MAG TPA: acetaldehyde dehydrogenase (acetylating) [Candidatus Acidoferrales bacterium]
MIRDADLVSVQMARDLVERADEAQKRFAAFTQEQVDAVIDAVAEAATQAAEPLARHAVEETGYGNVKDKIKKNLFSSVDVYKAIRPMRTVGILREDRENGIIEVAVPVGVVAAIIPSTNPTSTAIYKTLISLKARNGIVHSPHPAAHGCICTAVDIMTKAALQAGAPEGLIGCMRNPTMAGTQELMRHPRTSVILATGGTGLVRAAYSSGKPAFGVGPGNVPAYIERTANLRKAVADIITGKTFDYGTLCSAEQAILADRSIKDQVIEELRQQGAYFLSPGEIDMLGKIVILQPAFTANPKIVGKHPAVIAEMAGIQVPSATRVLIAPLEGVGKQFPLSAEKLSPILAFYTVENCHQAAELATSLLRFGGLGHTCAIHSNNEEAILEFGKAVPAFRVVVNTPAVHGSIGYSTRLFPAMTLGCGAVGNNITSDNIGPQHLMNIKRIAHESRAVEPVTDHVPMPPRSFRAAAGGSVAAAPAPDRAIIARVVEQFLSQRGIPRGGGPAAASAPSRPAGPAAEESPSGASPASAAPPVAVAEFVSEADVLAAISRREKIWIGPGTIVTPSAREIGTEKEVLIETDQMPAGRFRTSGAASSREG